MDDLSHHLIPVQFAKTKSTVWAEVVDANLPVDFENLVPNPAFTWNFELDSFQKQVSAELELLTILSKEKFYVIWLTHSRVKIANCS